MQDARFQQLYEQYQDTVLRAARELEDAADRLRPAPRAGRDPRANRCRRRAARWTSPTIQYREGLVDFQRVLDSQRALFSQQERLVTTPGRRRAEPDRPLQGDGRRLAGGPRRGRWSTTTTRATMARAQRLEATARRPAAAAADAVPATAALGHAMNQEPTPRPARRPGRRPAAGSGARAGSGAAWRHRHRCADRRRASSCTSSATG